MIGELSIDVPLTGEPDALAAVELIDANTIALLELEAALAAPALGELGLELTFVPPLAIKVSVAPVTTAELVAGVVTEAELVTTTPLEVTLSCSGPS